MTVSTPRLLVTLAVLAGAMLVPDAASAHRDRGRRGGGVRVQGSVQVHGGVRVVHRPHHATVHVHAGGGFVVHGGFAEPPPPPPPCDCHECAPPAYYYEPPAEVVAEPPVMIVQPAPRRRRLGVGLAASTVDVAHGSLAGAAGDLLLRYRGRRTELELDFGHISYAGDIGREDTRIGAALHLNLVRGRRFVPYLLVGAGLNVIHQRGVPEPLGQGYLAAGGGLALRLSPAFSVATDLRFTARHAGDTTDPTYHGPRISVPAREGTAELRIAGVVYF